MIFRLKYLAKSNDRYLKLTKFKKHIIFGVLLRFFMKTDQNHNFTKLEILLANQKNIFNLDDLGLLWTQNDRKKISDLAGWYVDQGKLYRIKQGIFATKNILESKKEEDFYELAQKLVTPSYISYHTILSKAGINFQYYSSIFSCSLVNKEILLGDKVCEFHKIEPELFFNPVGILVNNIGIAEACPERALIDTWYINPSIGIDNPRGLNLEKLTEIAKIFNKAKINKNLKIIFDIKI